MCIRDSSYRRERKNHRDKESSLFERGTTNKGTNRGNHGRTTEAGDAPNRDKNPNSRT